MEERAAFGELLRRHRLAAGLTQEALAERTGLSVRGISDLERGARRTPHPGTVERLVRALDLSDAERVDLQAIRDRRAAVSANRRHPQPRSNLPVTLTSFVGRESELDEIGRLMEPCRLLTLVGPGGVGKSRLALEVARLRLGRHPDGVWLVDLAPLLEPTLLARTVASILGVIEGPSRSLEAALAWLLRERNLLLVLDNCEHLIDACAWLLDRLLRSCPDLRVIATSREPLGIGGEQLFDVAPLAVPAEGECDLARLRANEAVHFFAERVRLARPEFVLNEDVAQAVTTICRRLDGIPLALELAAARIRTMSLAEIAPRLVDRFSLLTSGQRTAQPRHRTLRAMVDWSWDLLSEPERTLLRRLAVFAGGWTREAVQLVCGGQREGDDCLGSSAGLDDLLGALVDRSLVMRDDWRGSQRYRLLDTLRSYADERLREAGQKVSLRQRHLDWVRHLVEHAEPLLWTAEQKIWVDRLDRELPNLRAALACSLDLGQTESGLRIAGGLWRFWEQRGHVSEARRWLSALLAQPASERSTARATALTFAGYFAYMQGDGATAWTLAAEALELARALDDPFTFVVAIQIQSILTSTTGDLDRTEAYLQEGLDRARKADAELGVRVSLLNLGELARMRGDNRAELLLGESLALSANAGDVYTQAFTLTCLAHLALLKGDLDISARRHRRALTLWHALDDIHNLPGSLEGLAWTASAEERAERAARLLGAASVMRERTGTEVYPRWQADHERARETARAALGESAFSTVWQQGRAMSWEHAIAYALEQEPTA